MVVMFVAAGFRSFVSLIFANPKGAEAVILVFVGPNLF